MSDQEKTKKNTNLTGPVKIVENNKWDEIIDVPIL